MVSRFFSRIYKKFVDYKLYHIPFWILYIFFWSLVLSSGGSMKRDFANASIIIFFHIIVSYFNNYVLIDWFLFKRKFGPYIISLALSITLVCFPMAVAFHRYIPLADQSIRTIWTPTFFLVNALYVLFTVSITASVRLFRNWYLKEQANKQLEKLNVENELNFLKSQINPHFLFNSLNNLYALTLKQSELAPEVVIKLSNILRFGLYESSNVKVPLDTDIRFMQDYLELEGIRIGSRATIEFVVAGETRNKQIEPLLFINFIENAFKHGANAIAGKSFIHIRLEISGDGKTLSFFIENSKPVKEQVKPEGYKGGIGLKNVEKRLNILYPERHSLNIVDQTETYTVNLILQLT